ncbi:MAG: hypothetical protein ACI9FU_000394, partial [Granulosicoccus sp.]
MGNHLLKREGWLKRRSWGQFNLLETFFQRISNFTAVKRSKHEPLYP